MPKARQFIFPIEIFDLSNPYHKWVFSLAHAANDAQLFSHLFMMHNQLYEGPIQLLEAEKRTLFYHAIAHTYELLELLFYPHQEIGPCVKKHLEAVCQSEKWVNITEIKKNVRKSWDGGYREEFKKIRNLLVAYYARSEAKNEYWGILQATIAETEGNQQKGISIITGEEINDNRYRHIFVDMLQDYYIGNIFGTPFWGKDGKAQSIAEFLDRVTGLLNYLLVPLILRLMSPEQQSQIEEMVI